MYSRRKEHVPEKAMRSYCISGKELLVTKVCAPTDVQDVAKVVSGACLFWWMHVSQLCGIAEVGHARNKQRMAISYTCLIFGVV